MKRRPTICVLDDFHDYPQAVAHQAANAQYFEDLRYYKGFRSAPHRDPAIKSMFETILDAPIVDWDSQPFNGCFQITNPGDPIVWHADTQQFAAALYLDAGCNPDAGTSFWRHRETLCRRSPFQPEEYSRFSDDDERLAASHRIFNDWNYVHPDPWELVDRVAASFNRCVIWDAKLIHSATSYQSRRCVQLFFFTVG
jgi:hypothetical protein